jgi:hypothetical protein
MPSTDRKLELKAKTSVAQTDSQPYVYAKGLKEHAITEFLPVEEIPSVNIHCHMQTVCGERC